jgi:hypothetical protein
MVFPERFLIAIMIAIEMVKLGSDFEMKITDRFSCENRDPISVRKPDRDLLFRLWNLFQARFSIADRSETENHDPILI